MQRVVLIWNKTEMDWTCIQILVGKTDQNSHQGDQYIAGICIIILKWTVGNRMEQCQMGGPLVIIVMNLRIPTRKPSMFEQVLKI
jgi:hypothetical protein